MSMMINPYVFSVPFNPLDLFAGGRLGAWYDISDLSTMWQDSAGTAPAAVDQPVGKLNDKSGNGNHLSQATGSARPTLRSSGGKYWLEFSGSQYLTGTGLGFNFAHNLTTGMHTALAARFGTVTDPEAVYSALGNNGGTSTAHGIFVGHDTRSSASRDRLMVTMITRGVAAAFTYNADTPTASAPANTDLTYMLDAPTAASAGAMQVYINNSLVLTSARQNAPSSGSATNAMQLGASGASNLAMVGRIYQALLLDRPSTTVERSNLQTYLQGKMP